MTNINISICPICQSKDIQKTCSAVDHLVSKKSFDIMECQSCTLRFTTPIPDEVEIQDYYKSDDYISHTNQGKSIISKIYRIIQLFTLRVKRKNVEEFANRKTGKLLDIGCGTGKFLQIMQKSGWEVNGVEENSLARSTAENSIAKNIIKQNEYINSDDKYDVITMWHSLEHLHELKRYAQKVSISLNANGVLMVAVPNYNSYDAEYYRENWAAYDVPRHLYHFSTKAITKLFSDNGFTLRSARQLAFDPFYVSLLSEIRVKGKNNIINALIIGWKSYLKGRSDAKCGSSILYIFNK